MFDFQKLHVFQKAKAFPIDAGNLVKSGKFDKTVNDQFRRASLSIMLNISDFIRHSHSGGERFGTFDQEGQTQFLRHRPRICF